MNTTPNDQIAATVGVDKPNKDVSDTFTVPVDGADKSRPATAPDTRKINPSPFSGAR